MFQLVVHSLPRIVVVVVAVRKEHKMHKINDTSSITPGTSARAANAGWYGGFENRAEFSTAPRFFLCN